MQKLGRKGIDEMHTDLKAEESLKKRRIDPKDKNAIEI